MEEDDKLKGARDDSDEREISLIHVTSLGAVMVGVRPWLLLLLLRLLLLLLLLFFLLDWKVDRQNGSDCTS